MGWIIALVLLTGLAVLPLGVSAIYDSNGAVAYILAGPVRVRIFPAKSNKETSSNPKKEKKKEAASQNSSATVKPKKKKGGSLSDFIPLLESIFEFLGKFRRKLRVNRLEMKLILAGGDPADLAANYGKAWAILGNLMPLLERYFVIKKRDLEVECDFLADQTSIIGRLDLTITLGRLISLVVVHGTKILCQFLKIMKTRKGGAKL